MNYKNTKMNGENEVTPSAGLGFFQQTNSSTLTRFFLDEEIMEPHYYRNLLQVLLSASDNDVIEIWINTRGGDISSTEAIVSAIQNSEAQVVGLINGMAYSAGSVIALSCPNLVVLDSASMMIHESSYGAGGKSSDIRGYVGFLDRKLDRLIDTVYEGYLTPDEIVQVKNGKELWMLPEEIEDRLEKRNAYFEEKLRVEQDAVEEERNPTPVPERQPRKRRTPVAIED